MHNEVAQIETIKSKVSKFNPEFDERQKLKWKGFFVNSNQPGI
jgi:hypothetical protein